MGTTKRSEYGTVRGETPKGGWGGERGERGGNRTAKA
jgi:hypothetical protein